MTKTGRRSAAALGAAACVLLTACGSGAKAGSAARPAKSTATADSESALAEAAAAKPAGGKRVTVIDPCSLLTDAEAGIALGGPASHQSVPAKDATIAQATVTENRCSYELVTSDQLGHQIYLAVFDGADRRYYDQTSDSHNFNPIQGLGDAATGSANEVHVFSKGVALEIYGSVPAADGLQHVAALAIAKL